MRELDEGLEENADHLIDEVEAALGRIEDGTYGTCAVCGKPIAEERLEAVPVGDALHRRQARAGARMKPARRGAR